VKKLLGVLGVVGVFLHSTRICLCILAPFHQACATVHFEWNS